METRSPFVLGIHDLYRRPGLSRTLELELPAPAGMAIEVVGIPEGSPLTVSLRLDSVVEGILASAEIAVVARGECSRCLVEVTPELTPSFAELFSYPGALEIQEDDEDADEITELVGEEIDIEPLVRDAIVLALPFQPLCRPDCRGLCPECGIDLNSAPLDHAHEVIDARWAALVDAFDRDASAPADDATNEKDVP